MNTGEKKYSVIYADPPWKLTAGVPLHGYTVIDGKQVWKRSGSKSRPVDFETMTLQEIASLPINEISNKDAHLYIWVTNSHLPFVFEIIKQWGFTYSTTLVWAKNRMGGGLGGAFRITTEFLIFARKGKLKTKEITGSTWFNVKREYKNGFPKHSMKPSFFHELIEKTSPAPYLELFARRQRQGWDVFGNEVEQSIKLIA